MSILRRVILLTGYGALATVGTVAYATRKTSVLNLAEDDQIYGTTFFHRLRQSAPTNPTTSDVCIRRVPLASIDPQYLEPEGRLAVAYCQRVFGGLGYAYQRRYLERKYGADTPGSVWSRDDLRASDYKVGTHITDHFEVLGKSDDSITIRCGDSPREQRPRASDGIMELTALKDVEKGEVEFQLKCVFFNSETETLDAPMPAWIESLHRWYSRILLETSVRTLLK